MNQVIHDERAKEPKSTTIQIAYHDAVQSIEWAKYWYVRIGRPELIKLPKVIISVLKKKIYKLTYEFIFNDALQRPTLALLYSVTRFSTIFQIFNIFQEFVRFVTIFQIFKN